MNPMHTPNAAAPLPPLLQALRALYPPRCVVHVGVGQGTGELAAWRQWPDLPRAVLIDADGTRIAWARQGQSSWQVLHATVAASAATHPYHRASNPQEDGLLPPELLKPWWPQLTALGTEQRATQTLDQLVSPNSPSPAPANAHWLLLDCLPAAALLQGANQLLAHTSVVCARTSQASADSPLAITSHQALVDLLAPLGFVVLAQSETHHPALGYSLLARQPAWAAHPIAADPPAQLGPAPHVTPTDELQAENNALHQRLALLQEELLRAEGQINLIKDLMLRDQEL